MVRNYGIYRFGANILLLDVLCVVFNEVLRLFSRNHFDMTYLKVILSLKQKIDSIEERYTLFLNFTP